MKDNWIWDRSIDMWVGSQDSSEGEYAVLIVDDEALSFRRKEGDQSHDGWLVENAMGRTLAHPKVRQVFAGNFDAITRSECIPSPLKGYAQDKRLVLLLDISAGGGSGDREGIEAGKIIHKQWGVPAGVCAIFSKYTDEGDELGFSEKIFKGLRNDGEGFIYRAKAEEVLLEVDGFITRSTSARIDDRLWPDYARDWYRDAKDIVPHDWDNLKRNMSADAPCGGVTAIRTYLTQLLGFNPVDDWFNDLDSFEVIFKELKHIVGWCALMHCGVENGREGDVLGLGGSLLLLASKPQGDSSGQESSTDENWSRVLAEFDWSSFKHRAEPFFIQPIAPKQEQAQAMEGALALNRLGACLGGANDSSETPLLLDVSVGPYGELQIKLDLRCTEVRNEARCSLASRNEELSSDGGLTGLIHDVRVALGKHRIVGRNARCAVNLYPDGEMHTILEIRACP